MREIGNHYAGPNEAFRESFFPEEPAPLLRTAIPDDYELIAQHAKLIVDARGRYLQPLDKVVRA